MRRSLILLVALILAACGSGGDSEETSVPDSVSSSPVASTSEAPLEVTAVGAGITDEDLETLLPPPVTPIVFPTQTPASEGALPVPLPQTLVASETEDVVPRGDFDYIYFRQTGGEDGIEIVIEFFGDGRVTYNGEEGTIAEANIANLNTLINDLNFFGLQGTMMSAAPSGSETYYYQVYIQRGNQQRSINSQDGFMPREYIAFLGVLIQYGTAIIQ